MSSKKEYSIGPGSRPEHAHYDATVPPVAHKEFAEKTAARTTVMQAFGVVVYDTKVYDETS